MIIRAIFKGLEMLWEKEKLLVMSNLSFFHRVFQRLVLQTHENICLFGKGSIKCINPFPNRPWFLRVCSTSLLKTLWEKEKLLIMSNFSFSNCVFYPFGQLFTIFIKFRIVVCKLFQFGRVYNLSFGRVNAAVEKYMVTKTLSDS